MINTTPTVHLCASVKIPFYSSYCIIVCVKSLTLPGVILTPEPPPMAFNNEFVTLNK